MCFFISIALTILFQKCFFISNFPDESALEKAKFLQTERNRLLIQIHNLRHTSSTACYVTEYPTLNKVLNC